MDFEKHILYPTPLKALKHPLLEEKNVDVWVKEDYRTHAAISGNKFRKLKYNLIEAKKQGFSSLSTFGGAFSNHIYALSAAAKLFGFQATGIIRGDELNEESSPTLRFAHKNSMRFHFVSRSAYRDKEKLIQDLVQNQFVIPEGGTNELALPGCAEILDEILPIVKPTHFFLAGGTGGTAAGILLNPNYLGEVHVVPVLKNGGFLREDIRALTSFNTDRLTLHTDYHFGGYAKIKPELSEFIENFERDYKIPLDRVYTAKLFYAVFDLIAQNKIAPKSRLIIYHSGGLQSFISA